MDEDSDKPQNMPRKSSFDPQGEDVGPQGEEDLTLMLIRQPFKDQTHTKQQSEIVTKNERAKPLGMMSAAVESIKPQSISFLQHGLAPVTHGTEPMQFLNAER